MKLAFSSSFVKISRMPKSSSWTKSIKPIKKPNIKTFWDSLSECKKEDILAISNQNIIENLLDVINNIILLSHISRGNKICSAKKPIIRDKIHIKIEKKDCLLEIFDFTNLSKEFPCSDISIMLEAFTLIIKKEPKLDGNTGTLISDAQIKVLDKVDELDVNKFSQLKICNSVLKIKKEKLTEFFDVLTQVLSNLGDTAKYMAARQQYTQFFKLIIENSNYSHLNQKDIWTKRIVVQLMAVIVLFENTVQTAYKSHLEELNISFENNYQMQANSLSIQDEISLTSSSNIYDQNSNSLTQYQESSILNISKRECKNSNSECPKLSTPKAEAITDDKKESTISKKSSTAILETNAMDTASSVTDTDTFVDFYEGFYIGDMITHFTPRDNFKTKLGPENFLNQIPDSRNSRSRKISDNYSSFSDDVPNVTAGMQIQNPNINWRSPAIHQVLYSNNQSFTPPTFDLDSIRKGSIPQSPSINENIKFMQFSSPVQHNSQMYNNSSPFISDSYYQMQVSNSIPNINNWQYAAMPLIFPSVNNNQSQNSIWNPSAIDDHGYAQDNNNESITYYPNSKKKPELSNNNHIENQINNPISNGNDKNLDNDAFKKNTSIKLNDESPINSSDLHLRSKNSKSIFFRSKMIANSQKSSPIGNGYNNGSGSYRKYEYESSRPFFTKDKYYDKPRLPPRFQRNKTNVFYEPMNN